MPGILNLGAYAPIVVAPKGCVKVDHFIDSGELDFTTYYNIRAGGAEFLAHVSGWSFDNKLIDIPVHDRKGYLEPFGRVGNDDTS